MLPRAAVLAASQETVPWFHSWWRLGFSLAQVDEVGQVQLEIAEQHGTGPKPGGAAAGRAAAAGDSSDEESPDEEVYDVEKFRAELDRMAHAGEDDEAEAEVVKW